MITDPKQNVKIRLAIDVMLDTQIQPCSLEKDIERLSNVIKMLSDVREELANEVPNLRPLE